MSLDVNDIPRFTNETALVTALQSVRASTESNDVVVGLTRDGGQKVDCWITSAFLENRWKTSKVFQKTTQNPPQNSMKTRHENLYENAPFLFDFANYFLKQCLHPKSMVTPRGHPQSDNDSQTAGELS